MAAFGGTPPPLRTGQRCPLCGASRVRIESALRICRTSVPVYTLGHGETTGRVRDAYEGFVKLQQMQPNNHELYVAAGQAAQAFGNAQGALDQFNKALSVVKVLLRARRAPLQRACMYPCALCACV